MNNKDLFNAINDIDEKFIADAGKYLTNDDLLHSDAIEIYPGKTRFSPLKLIASIAAAAVFITGISIAVNHYRGMINVDPNNAASDKGNGETEPTPDLATHAVKTTGLLPFKLIGPDGQQIYYQDITEVGGDITLEELNENNFTSVTCNFAYYALPDGCNYNSVDNPEMDFDAENTVMTRSFRRIYKGGNFGDLTVSNAYSILQHDKATSTNFLNKNVIEFSGSTTAEGYLVNTQYDYYFVFKNGADNLPITNYIVPEFMDTGVYKSELSRLNCDNGFRYLGDQLALKLDESEVYLVDRAMSNSNYIKATVTFDNITIISEQDWTSNIITCIAKIEKATVRYVDSIVTADNLFGETPFSAENEMALRAILGAAETVEDLQSSADAIKELTGYDNIKVYRGIANMAGEYGEEIPEGEITAGMDIELCNDEGEHVAAYKVFVYDLTRDD